MLQLQGLLNVVSTFPCCRQLPADIGLIDRYHQFGSRASAVLGQPRSEVVCAAMVMASMVQLLIEMNDVVHGYFPFVAACLRMAADFSNVA